jgi:hypothetical protein
VEHEHLVEALTFRYYAALLALAIIGALVGMLRQQNTWIWPILAVPLLLTFFHLFFHAKDRFHIPLDGVIALLSAIAVVEGARLARRYMAQTRQHARAPVAS